jgi:outer membrane protein TolC
VLVSVLLVSALLGGCVSASSSFRRVEHTVRERLDDADAPLAHVEASERDEADDGSLREILARPLSPDDAVAVTLLRSPEVRSALAELGIARAEVLTASTLPNVELDTEMRLGREDGPGDEVEAHVVIDLAQLIVIPLRRAAAESELRAAELGAANEVLRLTYVARSALIEAQRTEARRALMANVVEVTRAAWQTAQALFEAGNVASLMPATEEAMHQEARLMLARAELEALEAREMAVVAMGLSGPAARFELAGAEALPDGEAPSLDALESRAVGQSLQLMQIEETMRALGGRHEVSRMRGLLPELRAGVSGSYADQTFAFGPAFTIVLPIFDQGLGPSDAIEARLRVTAEQWTAAAIHLRSAVRRARNRLLSFRAQARFCEEDLLPARQGVLRETLLQYNAMSATPFAVLAARRAEVEAALMCVDARADYAIAAAALEQLLAGGSVSLDPITASMTARSAGPSEEH